MISFFSPVIKHTSNLLLTGRARAEKNTKIDVELREIYLFQQIQKYEKGIYGVSSIRLLQLSNYLKVPINYFFDSYAEYSNNMNKTAEGFMSVNYTFLAKIYSELTRDQKNKFQKLTTANETNLANIKTS